MMITGGVDTFNDIFMYMCFSKTPALSVSGDCRPFSDQADGTILGEGLGMLALRRLEDLINSAAVPPKARRATRPTRASVSRRLEGKARRASVKAGRGMVGE